MHYDIDRTTPTVCSLVFQCAHWCSDFSGGQSGRRDGASFATFRSTSMISGAYLGFRAATPRLRAQNLRSRDFKATQDTSKTISPIGRHSTLRRLLSTEIAKDATRASRWALVKQRFREKKAQMMVEYGSTFIFLHEFFGIMSYATVFTLISASTAGFDSRC